MNELQKAVLYLKAYEYEYYYDHCSDFDFDLYGDILLQMWSDAVKESQTIFINRKVKLFDGSTGIISAFIYTDNPYVNIITSNETLSLELNEVQLL